MAFGPYASTPAGSCLALFRVRRGAEATQAGRLLTLDTCLGTPFTVTSARDLDADELPATAYRWIPLRLTHPDGPLETRVS